MKIGRTITPLLLLLLFSIGQLKAQEQEQLPSKEVTKPSPWYVGITGGVPFGVSTFSSFGADKPRTGYNAGLYGGYRFNPVLSLELSMKWGQVALSAQDCCIEKGYWLGEDGMRYPGVMAAMNGWDYSDLKSSVTLQQYGLQLNVNVLGFFERTRQSRWTLEVSPLLAAVSTKATMKTISDNQKALQGSTAWHLGAGGNLQAGYRMTQNLSVAVYSGMTYLSGNRMDGVPQYLHKNNFLWESGVRLGWTFGKGGKGGKQKRKPTETAVAPQRINTEPSVGQEKAEKAEQPRTVPANKAETTVSASETKAKKPLPFPTLYFEFNSTSIAPSEQTKLQVMLELLQQHPDAQITITGWCDTTGTTAVNQRISLRRAETVKAWLTTNGIAASRITAIGSGSDYKETNAAKARRTDTTNQKKEGQL